MLPLTILAARPHRFTIPRPLRRVRDKKELGDFYQEKLQAVKVVLAGETVDTSTAEACRAERKQRLSDDPWRGTPGDDE